MSGLKGIGSLLHAALDPAGAGGRPFTYSFRWPEPEYDEDGGLLPVVSGPSLSWVPTGPVFTGCLAFLGEERR